MTIKKLFNAYFNQQIIAFNSGAIGGLSRGGDDIIRYRNSNVSGAASEKGSKLLIAVAETDETVPNMKDVSHAYRIFKEEGYDVEFINSDGKPLKFRKSDLTDPINRWFAEDASAQYKSSHPLKVKEVKPCSFTGIYFAGGRDPQWGSAWFNQLSELILNSNGVLAGSGAGKDAENQLDLGGVIKDGYNLPDSHNNVSSSIYGSSASGVTTAKRTWMIHRDRFIDSSVTTPEELALGMLKQLGK